MIPGFRMPKPASLTNDQLADALKDLDRHWDALIVLSAQHNNPNIMWLEDYYSDLVDEIRRRIVRYRQAERARR
jgi:predicted nucleic acid-binding protein